MNLVQTKKPESAGKRQSLKGMEKHMFVFAYQQYEEDIRNGVSPLGSFALR